MVLSGRASYIFHEVLVPFVCNDSRNAASDEILADETPWSAIWTGEAQDADI